MYCLILETFLSSFICQNEILNFYLFWNLASSSLPYLICLLFPNTVCIYYICCCPFLQTSINPHNHCTPFDFQKVVILIENRNSTLSLLCEQIKVRASITTNDKLKNCCVLKKQGSMKQSNFSLKKNVHPPKGQSNISTT